VTALAIEPFSIRVDEDTLTDLRARIRHTRWPDPAPGEPWSQGTDLDYLRGLLAYWADGFDWRARERELNAFAHFQTDLDGVRIHFVHERGGGIPLILTHGWPSCFLEYLPLVPLLRDRFDLVIPSLPGYGFSERPRHADYRDVAGLWHRLMQELGYERYGAGGGDFGAGVATVMALDQPERVLGLHLTTPELEPHLEPPLTSAEREYVDATRRWADRERGYSAIQSTKPQTVGYGLTDSPAGLAAWILEKWRSWTDSGGDLDARFGRDFLLTLLTIYWVTGTITTSLRDYYDNRWRPLEFGPGVRVRVPTAIATFAAHFVSEGEPPREWAERLYDVRRWTPMPRGGHFAPAEEPELVAADIAAFFADV
jgi:pimeloyl-ACP methyl ester carboxylesterase